MHHLDCLAFKPFGTLAHEAAKISQQLLESSVANISNISPTSQYIAILSPWRYSLEKITIFSNFEYITIYQQNIMRNWKILAKSADFRIFLLSLKRELRGLRTKRLITVAFTHERTRGSGFL